MQEEGERERERGSERERRGGKREKRERERGGEGGRARGTVRKPFAPNCDAPPLTTNAQRGNE